MGDYLSTVAAAVTIAVFTFPFLLAKKSARKAKRLFEIVYMMAMVAAIFLLGLSIGVGLAEDVASIKDAERLLLTLSWIALGVVISSGLAIWAIGQLYDD